MRFRRLSFEAFGPFTGDDLDLSGGSPGGLHVIYGPNEAGKSTSLRAVEGLLFGIPERSTDAHLHALKNLVVGAVLERGDGAERQELWVRRLKRRKDTLVDEQGHPFPDDVLAPWLAGLDRGAFERFGLDQKRLAEGALALLGGSEEGLFAAGTAGPEVARLLRQLSADAEGLYGRAHAKRPLNLALRALDDARRGVRLATHPPDKWREQKRAYELALERVHELREKRRVQRQEEARLGRLAAVLSDVSRWVSTTEALALLGQVPTLPEDTEERRLEAERAHRDAEREVARLEEELSELTAQASRLPPPSSLLEVEEERWAALSRAVGAELKARADRPKIEAELEARHNELKQLFARLAYPGEGDLLTRADELRAPTAVERQARRLSARAAKLALAVDEADRRLEQLLGQRARLGLVTNSETDPLDLDNLELLLARARRVEARSVELQRQAAERDTLFAGVERRRSELGVTGAILGLAAELPSAAEVAEAEREIDRLRDRERQLSEARLECEQREVRARAALAAQDQAGEVPSEERLAMLRAARDTWLAELHQSAGDRGALEGWARELSQRMAEADQVADRLRLEAHRVSEREKHLLALEDTRAFGTSLSTELERVREQRSLLEASWTQRFARLGQRPVKPSELGEVRQSLAELVLVHEQLELVERTLMAEERKASEVASELAHVLGIARVDEVRGRDLPAWMERGAERLRKAREERQQRRVDEQRRRELEQQLVEQRELAGAARAELDAWRASFREILDALDLPAETPPEEVEAVLAERAAIERAAADVRDKQRRIDGIDRDTARFAEQVRALIDRHAPALAGSDALDAAERLMVWMREAKQSERDRQRIERQLSEKREALATAQRARAAAWGVLSELMTAAGVTELSELRSVEAQAQKARVLEAERAELELSLRAQGESVESLIAEARGISRYELAAQQGELEAEVEETEEALRAADYDAKEKERGLALYYSEEAAFAEQRVEAAEAEVRQILREMLVLRTARSLLKREMTRHAERYEGPVLARASELFPRLTLGRYSGVRVGVGERTLRCLRGGKEIEVSELSQGSQAQLYLALRLASLEHHFARRTPIPLIFDDLLVDFDDERARAAFEIFGELAARVQILYFTHLGRDLTAARRAVPAERLFEHHIGVLSPMARPA